MLWYVFQKVDMVAMRDSLTKANVGWLIVAFFFFNLSIWISAERLKACFTAIGVTITFMTNLILYYVGMFYNLFLPGGIGGDGYKIFLLNRHFDGGVKQLFQAILLDRLSGLAALVILCAILFLGSGIVEHFPSWWQLLAWFFILITLPASWIVVHWFFRSFLSSFWRLFWLGMGVQLAQLFSAWSIFHALDIKQGLLAYLAIYLVSSVAAVLPLTIGGVGLREVTFLYAAEYLGEDPNLGITFSMLFFLMTALSSLIGFFVQYHLKRHIQREVTNR